MKSNIKSVSYAFAAITFATLTVQRGQPARSFNEPITSAEQAAAVPKGENVAMACSKCKTVQVAEVDREKSFLSWFKPKTKHVCPGCGGHWGYVVYGKGSRHGNYVHTCSKCGDKSVFCCATQPGRKTKGM
jgi:hypothetical protein